MTLLGSSRIWLWLNLKNWLAAAQCKSSTRPCRGLSRTWATSQNIEAIVEYIAEHGHVVDAPGLRQEHYEVFDCAMGERSIGPMGHVRMMAAVQPALSGAISNTVNLPESVMVEDIESIYLQGWKLGLKALAVYRDNCKVGQPLSDARKKPEAGGCRGRPSPHKIPPVQRRLPTAPRP